MTFKRKTLYHRKQCSTGDLVSRFLPVSFSSFYRSSVDSDEEFDKYIKSAIKIWASQSHPPDRVRKTILNIIQDLGEVETNE
jgi:hypothetical protein